MKAKSLPVLLPLILAGLIALAWWLARPSGAPNAVDPEGAAAVVGVSDRSDLLVPPQGAASDEERRAAGRGKAAADPRGDAPRAELQTATAPRVRAEFVDEAGAPLAGTELLFSPRGEAVVLAIADERGRLEDVALRVSPGREDAAVQPILEELIQRPRLLARSGSLVAQIEPAVLQPGRTLELGRVVLLATGRIDGRVRTQDGTPFASARIQLYDAENPHEERLGSAGLRGLEATTNSDGAFLLQGIPLDRPVVAMVQASRAHTPVPFPAVTLTEARPSVVQELTLSLPIPQPRTIEGRVLLQGGEPAAGALVHARAIEDGGGIDFTAFAATADEQGAYVLQLEDESVASFRVTANLLDQALRPDVLWGVPPGARGVDLELGPEAWLDVHLVDGQGAPIPWGNLRAHVQKNGCLDWPQGRDLLPTGESGRVRFPQPPCDFRLQVWAPGFATQTVAVVPSELDGPLVIELEIAPMIRGRVTHRGRPIPGAKVGVLETHGQGGIRAIQVGDGSNRPVRSAVPLARDRHDATTDAEGRFVAIPPRGAQTYRILVQAEGFPRTLGQPFEFDAMRSVDLDVVLQRAGAIEGAFRGDLESGPFRPLIAATDGSGRLRVTPIDENGSWRLENLQPGGWQVRLAQPPLVDGQLLRGRSAQDSAAFPSWEADDVVVPESGVGRLQLGPGDLSSSVLEGQLTLVRPEETAPRVTDFRVQLVAVVDGVPDEFTSVRGPVEAFGAFRLRSDWRGPHVLRFECSTSRSSGIEFSLEIPVQVDGLRVEDVRLELCRLEAAFSEPWSDDHRTRDDAPPRSYVLASRTLDGAVLHTRLMRWWGPEVHKWVVSGDGAIRAGGSKQVDRAAAWTGTITHGLRIELP